MDNTKLYFLEKNPFYDNEFSDKVYDYFKDVSNFENVQKVAIDQSSKDMNKVQFLQSIQTKIANECKLFIQKNNKI